MPTILWVLLHLEHLLDTIKKIIRYNSWNTAIYSNVAVDIDPAVPLIMTNTMKTPLVPLRTFLRADPSTIKILCNIRERFIAGNSREDLLND